MFLTAQRVRSPWSRKVGINVFLFHHGADKSALIDWNRPDAELVLQQQPGELVAELIEVVPGANSVDSYLDILAPDGTPKQVLLGALNDATGLVGPPHFGVQLMRGRVALRLNTERLPPADRPAEFQALKERVAALLSHPAPAPWHGKAPLTVREQRAAEGVRYQLDEPSVARIRELLGERWEPPSVSVPDEVRSQFGSLHGDLLPQVLPTLVGLSAESALALGGVVVMDGDGKPVLEWPAQRGPGVGYCAHCHRHNTLREEQQARFRCSACGNEQESDGLWVATLAS
jgi:hypothetical protein